MAIYLLHGDSKSTDPQLIRERLDELLADIPTEGNLNFTTCDLSESGTSFYHIIDAALTIPFLGGRRVVVAKNAKSIEKSFIKKDDPDVSLSDSQELLVKAVERLSDLPDDALLILVEENSHLDGRTAFYRKLKKVGCKVETFKAMWFDPATGNIGDAIKYIQSEAPKYGIRLDHPTAEAFVIRVGSDRATMLRELEKLALYVESGSSPTVEDVENVVTQSYEAGIFTLVDYIGLGRTDKALESLDDLFERDAAPPYILAMIARQIRIIAQVRTAIDRGVADEDIASELSINPFVVKKIFAQLRTFRKFEYPQVLEWLMETDVHLKRGTMPGKPPGKLALEILITKLAGGPVDSRSYRGGYRR